MDWTGPDALAARARLVTRFGVTAESWWPGLPALADGFAAAWSLDPVEIAGRGGTSIVLRCRDRSGADAYLKLAPEPALASAEAAALDYWSATGRVPRVLERDLLRGTLLLEGIGDGRPLAETGAVPSVEAIAALVRALHGARGGPAAPSDPGTATSSDTRVDVTTAAAPLDTRVDFTFDRTEERRRALADHTKRALPVTDEHLARARHVAHQLCATAPDAVLLHGDLHAGNVIAAGLERDLIAIDPRPHHGDPAFDLVDWIPWQTPPVEWRSRADLLAALTALEPARVWAWFRAFAALFALIEIERGGGPTPVADAFLAIAV